MSEEEISNRKVLYGTRSFYQSSRPKKEKRHKILIHICNNYISLHYELEISIYTIECFCRGTID